jgi:hypothetical protein
MVVGMHPLVPTFVSSQDSTGIANMSSFQTTLIAVRVSSDEGWIAIVLCTCPGSHEELAFPY